jgi:glycosyltransferase involved in cell wall biosynthesis
VFSIDPTRIGGAETFARELSRQIGEVGWLSVLSTLSTPPEPVAQFLSLPNVRLETCACATVSARAVRELAGILVRHRPRILHLHFMGMLTPYAWLAKLCGVEQVYFTDHWSRPEGSRPGEPALWKRALARMITAPLTRVISVSDFNRAFLSAHGTVPTGKITRIHNAVDLTRAHSTCAAGGFRRRYGIPADRRLVVQVSMIIPEKGVADLLDAAEIVVAQDPAAHFVFVGEGAPRSDFVRRAAARGLGDHVTFTGPILNPVGDGVFAEADVLCQVSRWEEAFGWAIVEGMSFAKPVVGTRVGGIPEVIEDGVTGCLAGRGDARQIASHILLLLRDPAARERMGLAGRAAVERKFDLRTNVGHLVKLYGIS